MKIFFFFVSLCVYFKMSFLIKALSLVGLVSATTAPSLAVSQRVIEVSKVSAGGALNCHRNMRSPVFLWWAKPCSLAWQWNWHATKPSIKILWLSLWCAQWQRQARRFSLSLKLPLDTALSATATKLCFENDRKREREIEWDYVR